jgi:chemotaxis signal transduction protein
LASSTTPTASSGSATPSDRARGGAARIEATALDDAAVGPQLLLVAVGGVRFACRLEDVREVVPGRATARLPGAEPWVVGLVNLRGRLLTVLDVARRLDLDPPSGDGHVLVVEAGGREAGCRVATVDRVVPAPPLAPASNAEAGGIVLGVGEVDGEPVAVLDLPRFVSETLLDPGER